MWFCGRPESMPVAKGLAGVPHQLIWRNLRRDMHAPCNIAERFSCDTFMLLMAVMDALIAVT